MTKRKLPPRHPLTGQFRKMTAADLDPVNVSADDVRPGMSRPKHGPGAEPTEAPGKRAAIEINAESGYRLEKSLGKVGDVTADPSGRIADKQERHRKAADSEHSQFLLGGR